MKELEKEIEILKKENIELHHKINLLSDDTKANRLMLEKNITYNQYMEIRNLFDIYITRIDSNIEVNNHEFEKEIFEITGDDMDWGFCELLSESYYSIGKWKEVYENLYM